MHGSRQLLKADGMKLIFARLHLRYAFCDHNEASLPDQAIKLSEIANISKAIVRRRATSTDTMQTQLSNAKRFKITNVSFAEVCV